MRSLALVDDQQLHTQTLNTRLGSCVMIWARLLLTGRYLKRHSGCRWGQEGAEFSLVPSLYVIPTGSKWVNR